MVSKHSTDDYVSKLTDSRFEAFKLLRNRITTFFNYCQRLHLKLTSDTKSRDHVQLELSFAGNVLEKLKPECTDEVRNLNQSLENKLILAALEEADSLIEDMNETLIDSNMSDDQLFLISKAFRAVLIHNREISKDLMYCLPKGAGPKIHRRASEREKPSHNYVTRHKSAYNDKRSDHPRPQRPNTYAPSRRTESPGPRDERPRKIERRGSRDDRR